MQQANYDAEGAALEREGELIQQDAEIAARQKENEVKNVMADQAVAYLNSGVTLDGTPLDVIDRTRRQGYEEVTALRSRGASLADIYRRRGQITRSTGRAAILGSRYQQGVEEARNEMAINRTFGNSALSLIGQGVFRAGTPLVRDLWNAIKNP